MRSLQTQWTAAVVLFGTVAVTGALAQQTAQPQRTPAGRAPAGRAPQAAGQQHETQLDEHVATCLILENDGEIAAAQIAEQNAKSDDVKQFARTMVKDHEQFVSQLERFAGPEWRNRRQQEGNRTGAAKRNENTATRERETAASDDVAAK